LEEERLISLKEAAALSGLSAAHLRRLAEKGQREVGVGMDVDETWRQVPVVRVELALGSNAAQVSNGRDGPCLIPTSPRNHGFPAPSSILASRILKSNNCLLLLQ